MKQIVIIKSTPAIFTVDFEKAKTELEKSLKKYDVVVTEDTVKDAKKLTADLNKQATELNDRRKEAVDAVSAPIRKFEEGMKSLVTMCKKGREKIMSQIVVFENRVKSDLLHKLEEYRSEKWKSLDVKGKFQDANINDMILLTNITTKGSLAAKARFELDRRVDADKQQQTMIEMRLLQLENKCFRAGLKAVLTETHVELFLYTAEPEYNARLESLINIELGRQKETEEKVREEVKNNTPVAEDKGEEAIDKTYHAPTEEKERVTATQQSTKTKVQSVKSKRENVVWTATALFEVEVPAHIPAERIKAKLEKMFADAGITSLQSIQVNKNA